MAGVGRQPALNPIDPPANVGEVVAPVRWLIELASQPRGAELTLSSYLARATVLAEVERVGCSPR